MAWEPGSGRTATKEWKALRVIILERDEHRCTAIQQNGERCPEKSPLVIDHIKNAASGGTDEHSNLQTLCKWHHDRKTAKEASAARTAKPRVKNGLRPPEIHPALRSKRSDSLPGF